MYGLSSVTVYLFATFDGATNLIDFIPWGFVNIRYWSHIATWCLPLIPLAVLVGPLRHIRSWRILVFLGAGMWWWILLLTTGRGAILGIAFGVLFTLGLFGRPALPWLRHFLVCVFVGLFLWLALSVVIPSFLEEGVHLREIKAHSSGRISLFEEAWVMSLQNFPLGMGPQSWLTHDPLSVNYVSSKKFGHPHNVYLMWAEEYGWLVIVALGVIVFQAIRYFWSSRRLLLARDCSSEDHECLLLLAGFTASVSAALFHAGASAVFMAPGSMLVGLFVLIGFWGLIMPPGLAFVATDRKPQRASVARILGASIIGAAILLAWLAWMSAVWSYYQDMRRDELYYHESTDRGMLPRFWYHGNFPR
jgi:hypothetical protein